MKKTEVPGIYKIKEGVLINNDTNALAAYKKRKKNINKLKELENELSEMRSDIQEIKKLLKELIK